MAVISTRQAHVTFTGAKSVAYWQQRARAPVSRARQPATGAGLGLHGSSGATGHVFLLRTPLVGWEGLEGALGRHFPGELALHEAIVLQTLDGTCKAYDFLPAAPTEPRTIQALLLGGRVSGDRSHHSAGLAVRALPGMSNTGRETQGAAESGKSAVS